MKQLQAQGKTAVSLMRGEPDSKTPPHIAEAAMRALQPRPHAASFRPDCRDSRFAPLGFFAMVDAPESSVPSNDIRKRLLHDHGVVVAHGSAYGGGAEGTLRVSFGSGGDTLARGLERLRQGLSQL